MSGRLPQSECSNVTAFSMSVAVPTFNPFHALRVDVNAPCSLLRLEWAWEVAKLQTAACDFQRQSQIAHAYAFLRADNMFNLNCACRLWSGRAASNLVQQRSWKASGRTCQECHQRLQCNDVGTFLAATKRIEVLMDGWLSPSLLHLWEVFG